MRGEGRDYISQRAPGGNKWRRGPLPGWRLRGGANAVCLLPAAPVREWRRGGDAAAAGRGRSRSAAGSRQPAAGRPPAAPSRRQAPRGPHEPALRGRRRPRGASRGGGTQPWTGSWGEWRGGEAPGRRGRPLLFGVHPYGCFFWGGTPFGHPLLGPSLGKPAFGTPPTWDRFLGAPHLGTPLETPPLLGLPPVGTPWGNNPPSGHPPLWDPLLGHPPLVLPPYGTPFWGSPIWGPPLGPPSPCT